MDEQMREKVKGTADRLIAEFCDSVAEQDWPMWATEAAGAMEDLLAALSQPAASQVPLTDDQIKTACGASDVYWAHSKLFIKAIAKATEAAHGIA